MDINSIDYCKAEINVYLNDAVLSVYIINEVPVILNTFVCNSTGKHGVLITSCTPLLLNGELLTEGIQDGISPIFLEHTPIQKVLPVATSYEIFQVHFRDRKEIEELVSRIRVACSNSKVSDHD